VYQLSIAFTNNSGGATADAARDKYMAPRTTSRRGNGPPAEVTAAEDDAQVEATGDDIIMSAITSTDALLDTLNKCREARSWFREAPDEDDVEATKSNEAWLTAISIITTMVVSLRSIWPSEDEALGQARSLLHKMEAVELLLVAPAFRRSVTGEEIGEQLAEAIDEFVVARQALARWIGGPTHAISAPAGVVAAPTATGTVTPTAADAPGERSDSRTSEKDGEAMLKHLSTTLQKGVSGLGSILDFTLHVKSALDATESVFPNAWRRTKADALIRNVRGALKEATGKDLGEERTKVAFRDLATLARAVRLNVAGKAASEYARAQYGGANEQVNVNTLREPLDDVDRWLEWCHTFVSDQSFVEALDDAIVAISTAPYTTPPSEHDDAQLFVIWGEHVRVVDEKLRVVHTHPRAQRLLALEHAEKRLVEQPYQVLSTMVAAHALKGDLRTRVLNALYVAQTRAESLGGLPQVFATRSFWPSGGALARCSQCVSGEIQRWCQQHRHSHSSLVKSPYRMKGIQRPTDPSMRVAAAGIRSGTSLDHLEGWESEDDDARARDATSALADDLGGFDLDSTLIESALIDAHVDDEVRARVLAFVQERARGTCDACGEDGHFQRDCPNANVKGAREKALAAIEALVGQLKNQDVAAKRRAVNGLLYAAGIQGSPRQTGGRGNARFRRPA